VTKLLADGYLVHEDGALRIRNFRKGQTGITDDAPKAESAAPSNRPSICPRSGEQRVARVV
jgi:hypothetical protein